ncbi:hypothetical protein MJ560_03320 [Klebsiella pneumoniae]|nr:hypothetical protein MJ560_03320 [Klebsiella pneumoniae]
MRCTATSICATARRCTGEKGVAIVQRLRDAVDLWKEETGYGFSLYSTPSENLCDRFCAISTPPSLAWWKG